MKLFRLEHPSDNCGPYHSNLRFDDTILKNLSDDMSYMHQDHKHPAFFGDFCENPEAMSSNVEHYLFCCTSLENLKEWFKGYLEEFLTFGFVVVEIEVEQYFIGDSRKQAIVRKDIPFRKQVVNI